jgi:glycosyltransferase involved in cell wall biosynthesis
MEQKNKIRFTLIFEELGNVHLHKDVGQIPYQLQKHFGYETEIVCRKNEDSYDYLDGELKGLNLRFIEGSIFTFLLKNAKKIDVLMLFHIKTETIYLALLYKLLNPKGILYVKHDLPDHRILYAEWGKRNIFTQLKRIILFKSFLPMLDLFSIECKRTYDQLTAITASKKIYLPNGFDPEIPAYYGVIPKPSAEKENIILLVGRHGSKQKNSEFLLKVLDKMGDIGNWQVIFIGAMTDEFIKYKDDFLKSHPSLTGKVHFKGVLDDKKLLFEYYNRSKMLCLPSRWESWGLVCGEALYFGNVLLMSDKIVSAFDLTNDGQAGFIVESENVEVWADKMSLLMRDQEMLSDYAHWAQEHFRSNLIWKNILEKLAFRILERRKALCSK